MTDATKGSTKEPVPTSSRPEGDITDGARSAMHAVLLECLADDDSEVHGHSAN
jgi:hypothetical protein